MIKLFITPLIKTYHVLLEIYIIIVKIKSLTPQYFN